jgi:hypothetical protein
LFDVAAMVTGYERVYRQIAGPSREPGRDLRLLTAS